MVIGKHEKAKQIKITLNREEKQTIEIAAQQNHRSAGQECLVRTLEHIQEETTVRQEMSEMKTMLQTINNKINEIVKH